MGIFSLHPRFFINYQLNLRPLEKIHQNQSTNTMTNKESFKDKMRRWRKEIYLFLTSFVFLKNIAGIFAFLGLLFFFMTYWMKCYTNHGESLQVHDYVGLELDDAVRKAKSRSFSIVVNDSIFLPGKPGNLVISQNPSALSRVKENRKVYLRVTKSKGEPVTLPNPFDGSDDFYSYQTQLKRMEVGSKIVGRVYSSKLEENTILEVIHGKDTITDELENKYQVEKGTIIGVIVTEKGGGSVPIPNLICQKYDAARFVISNYNLNIGSVIKDETVTNEYTAYIYRQMPRYKTSGSMRIGEQIDIYLTQKRPTDCGKDDFNIEDLNEESLQEESSESDPNSSELTAPQTAPVETVPGQQGSLVPTTQPTTEPVTAPEEEEDFDGEK